METTNTLTNPNAEVLSGPKAKKNVCRLAREVIGQIIGLAMVLVLGIPILLVPFTTSVPAPLWVLLLILAAALFILPFRTASAWIGMLMLGSGILALSAFAVWASQFFASTPPIMDAQGQVIPGSIASLEKVTLNESQQWISIRGKSEDNPVLLFLAGGPGGSQLATARHSLSELEEHFVVVNWDQPGSGKSYNAVEQSTLTPERYIQDGLALTNYLRERFEEDKIYVLGESWGSVLGIWMVQRSPELFHGFIGTGQMVDFLETDLRCYEFALQLAMKRGDDKKVAQLTAQGPPPYYGDGIAMKQAKYLLDTFAYMNEDPAITGSGFNTFRDLASPEYGLIDKVNWLRGPLVTLGYVYPHLWEVDLRTQAPELKVPVYFLIGRHDVNAPPVLTGQYYDLLDAPRKELVWFERSGHNPWVNEPEAFVEVIVDMVLERPEPGRKSSR
ncbi:MAG: alpha/beta hydrolase [Chloroflexi bacterium]|nr:MAG: alpha/beta hydrolase [Chloroflexota bacterium]MBL1195124.1 alpha/beta hydrolase [Chloroflexota bacterium]NOH12409.1 alpha/beta hydrolase [Chloroflexota bacterium]